MKKTVIEINKRKVDFVDDSVSPVPLAPLPKVNDQSLKFSWLGKVTEINLKLKTTKNNLFIASECNKKRYKNYIDVYFYFNKSDAPSPEKFEYLDMLLTKCIITLDKIRLRFKGPINRP
jgi:hypothetical protein